MAAHKNKALALATSIILSLSLFLFGFVYVLVKSAHQAALQSQKNIKLEVFFNEDLNTEEEVSWIESVQSRPEVIKTQLVTKDQAQLDFKNLMKNDWGHLIDEASLVGRLPASLIVEFQQDTSPLTRQKVASEIISSATQFTNFDGSVFQKDWAQWFADYSVLARRLSWTFGTLVFFMMYFIISNLIRSQVFHKADEIEIMSFLGATSIQIQTPFIMKAVAVGFVSTMTSLGLLYYLIDFTKKYFLEQAPLFSLDLLLRPSLFEALFYVAAVCLICGWAASVCVRDRLCR